MLRFKRRDGVKNDVDTSPSRRREARENPAAQFPSKEITMPSFRLRVIAAHKVGLAQAKKDFKRDNALLHSAQADSVGRASLKLAVKHHKQRIKMYVREIAYLERAEKTA
jgi:hypothetical protein